MKKYLTEIVMWQVKAKITEVEVERESDFFVWVNGRRHNKESEYEKYHDSWEQAHDYLINEANIKVDKHRTELEIHKIILDKVYDMKKP